MIKINLTSKHQVHIMGFVILAERKRENIFAIRSEANAGEVKSSTKKFGAKNHPPDTGFESLAPPRSNIMA